jgi:hypothetical protein
VVHAPRHQHDEDAVAAGDGLLDHCRVGRAWNDRDPALKLSQLVDALLTADADDFMTALQGVAEHVPAELARRADDADLHPTPTLNRRQRWVERPACRPYTAHDAVGPGRARAASKLTFRSLTPGPSREGRDRSFPVVPESRQALEA